MHGVVSQEIGERVEKHHKLHSMKPKQIPKEWIEYMTLEGYHSPRDPTQTRCVQVAVITVPEHKKVATPHLKEEPVACVNTLANYYFFREGQRKEPKSVIF